MQSVPITTKVVSLKPVYGEVYSIQHYSPGTTVSPTNITDILLKVAINTINPSFMRKKSLKVKKSKQTKFGY